MTDLVALNQRKKVTKGRISTKLKAAIRNIVNNGVTQEEAALAVGIRRETVSRALQKPHVVAYKDELSTELLKLNALKGARKIGKLIDGANSERVQMEAAVDAQNRGGLGVSTDDKPVTAIQVNINLA